MALYTVATLTTQVRSILTEPAENFWLDSEIEDIIHWATRTMSGITLCTPVSANVTTTTDTMAYTIASAQLIRVDSVTFTHTLSATSTTYGLQCLDIRNFGHGASDGASTDTNRIPKWYYVFGDYIYLWPVPKGAVATGGGVGTSAVVVYGWTVAQDYDQGATTYDVPDRLQGRLIDFVLAMCYAKSGKHSLTRYHMSNFMQNAIMDRKDIHDRIPTVDSLDRFAIPDRTVQPQAQQ